MGPSGNRGNTTTWVMHIWKLTYSVTLYIRAYMLLMPPTLFIVNAHRSTLSRDVHSNRVYIVLCCSNEAYNTFFKVSI